MHLLLTTLVNNIVAYIFLKFNILFNKKMTVSSNNLFS